MTDCTCQATELIKITPAPTFENGPDVAARFDAFRKLVDEKYHRLLAAVMSWAKWEQNELTKKGICGLWILTATTESCPLCIAMNEDCECCSLFIVVDPVPCGQLIMYARKGNKQPLLDALLAAIQYEIDALGDCYDSDYLRRALAGEKKCADSKNGRCQRSNFPCDRFDAKKSYCREGLIFPIEAEPPIVRRRTRYERWAEEGTELWCVLRDADKWDVENARIENYYDEPCPDQHLCVRYYRGEKRLGTTSIEVALEGGYLGESRQRAYEAAAAKWADKRTKLFWIYSPEYSEEWVIKRRISIGSGTKHMYVFHFGFCDVRFDSLNFDRDYLTPSIDRALEWLKEKIKCKA